MTRAPGFARGVAPLHAALCVGALAVVACSSPKSPSRISTGGGSQWVVSRPPTPAGWPDHYALGAPAKSEWIASLDTDVDTTGAGLPEGHGTAVEGAAVYAAKCAACHGPKGEGIPPSPVLIRPLVASDSFPWAKNSAAPKTVGNYWPFATTMYAYIRHAMPQSAPGSLNPNEVYQLVAYLLAENGVMPRETVLDAATLPKIKLPMRSRFVLDTRKGGGEVR